MNEECLEHARTFCLRVNATLSPSDWSERERETDREKERRRRWLVVTLFLFLKEMTGALARF